jgi:GntR family transcriptional regulator
MNKSRPASTPPPLRLNHASALPLHAQARQLLRELIRRPEYQDGALLPDEVSLAAKLGISRGTLRAGIAQLVHEGWLERKAGVGTRVRPQAAESGIGAWRSFSREMARKGIRVENFRRDYQLQAADEAAALALHLAPRAKLWRLDRVRGWHGRPVLLTRSWFHPRLGLTGREDFSKPLYEVIEAETGVAAENAREEFAAVCASAAMARLLAVRAGEPLLLRTHTVFDAGGRPIEFAQVHYVSARFTLSIEMRRENQ